MVRETITCNIITCKVCFAVSLTLQHLKVQFSGYEVKSAEWYLGKSSLLKSHSTL